MNLLPSLLRVALEGNSIPRFEVEYIANLDFALALKVVVLARPPYFHLATNQLSLALLAAPIQSPDEAG